ncbi:MULTISPECIES: hypothetical protein [unclassified Kitasatospora]|uniref:hypothetical protein n=1 Tax=unclassified Kitasatospora TaxID=2633591 RepID=UPI001ADF7B65|nr:hypothetical protein [Kitasatospora sp. RG8]MBP0455526.1 hypothetical protein [Kitasatospora sp. RG8]
MTHNDVARRTARSMPARSLTTRTLPGDGDSVPFPEVVQRALVRAVPSRLLHRVSEGGR